MAASRSEACGSTEGAAARRWQNGVVAIGDLRTPFDPSAADLSDGARSRYAIALRAEWNRLLDDDLFKEESNIQEFLERHPALVPGAFGPSIPSGHPPWPGAVITQPRLPDLSTKRPDFMWIATDSAFLRPVLVEIERPDKRWFHDNGGEQHSDLTTALSQVAHWRGWFNTDGNRTAFLRHYRVPSPLTDRPVRPHFIVVHGRRKEVLRSPAHQRLRSSIEAAHGGDTTITTFDRLQPDVNALDFGTAHLESDGSLRMVKVPATFALYEGPWERERVDLVAGLDGAISASPDLSSARKEELQHVLKELRRPTPRGRQVFTARRR